MKEMWSSILDRLRDLLPEGKFKVFLEPLRGDVVRLKSSAQELGQGSLVDGPLSAQWEVRLTAVNEFMAARVREQFMQPVAEVARELLGAPVRVTVRKAPAPREAAGAPSGQEKGKAGTEKLAAELPGSTGLLASSRQLDLPLPLPRRTFNPVVLGGFRHSFEDFVIGPCNQLAYAAASNIIEASTPVDMVFLSAGAGLGKTHLTQAVGRALGMEADRRQVRMEYLSAEDFTSQFVQASRFKAMDEFKERFHNLDMLLLEDVHFLRGKERTQEELLAIIKYLQAHGGKVVLTSSFMPQELAGVDEQLVSRFCSGFIAGIGRPDRDMRLKILHDKARRQCMVLPDSVAGMLADSVTGDVRMLESCIHNLMLQSRFTGNAVTEEMAMDVIRSVARVNPQLSMEDVVTLICRSFDLTPQQLASKSRRQNLVVARNTAFFLLRKHTDLTLEEIGERFNRRHSTVIKGITSVENEMKKHSALGGQIENAVGMIERSARGRVR